MTEQQVERRIVTVLFADLVGFTTLSERLDAEDVATVQDAYFGLVRETVGRYGGRLEKFIGDAAMAAFGVPRARDDDAARAVRAALALVHGIQQTGARLGLEEGALQLRVGVNTGEVVTATSGPDEGRVTGDSVNTAARLQAAAPPTGVLVGRETALAVADVAELESVGPLELKGKADATPAWLVVGLRAEASRDEAMGALRAPTLGRAAELSDLTAAWQRATGGAVERWLVVAPPGVGKSRLLRELAAVIEPGKGGPAAGQVLRARARPDALAPFEPVAGLLRAALDAAGLAAADAAAERLAAGALLEERLAAAGAAPARRQVVIESVTSIIWPSGTLAAEERDALFDAWLEAFDALAAGRPQAWLVEDIHWAGGDVLALLALAGSQRRAGRGGRIVVATARPSLLDSQPEWAAADPAADRHVLHLATLPADDAGALVRALVGDGLPAELVERVAARSDGNCLFIEELLRTWVSVGTLVEQRGNWQLTVAADEIPLPSSVQSIYAAQLDDLPPAARLYARRASVVGRRFPAAALAALGIDDQAADSGLATLARRELISGPSSEALWKDVFAYRHALLRDAGYSSLARAERARLHLRLARWLAGAAGERSDEVAESIAAHYGAALDSAPALARELDDGLDRPTVQRHAAEWYERAGRLALDVAAQDAARSLFRRAIELTPVDAPLELARRHEALGEATAYAADMDEGAAAYERAIELYRSALADADATAPTEARAGLARAVAALCDLWYQQLRFAESRDLAASVIAELGEPDAISLARLLTARALGEQGASGEQPGLADDLRTALALARQAGHQLVELRALEALALVEHEGGRGQPADWQRVHEMAAQLGEWGIAIAALSNHAIGLLDDRAEEVFVTAEATRELAAARGRTEDVGWADYLVAEAAFVAGDWDRALEASMRAVELGEANAYRRLTVRTWHVVVPIATARGDRALLERVAAWYAGLSGPFPDSPYARVIRAAQDLELAAAGLVPLPLLEVEPRIVSYQDEPGGPSWTAALDRVFRHWIEHHELEGAARILAAMTEALPRYPTVSSLGRGTHRLLGGRLALARGDRDAAGEAGAAALEHFRTSKAPWWMAKAIRLLERAGVAGPTLVAEAAEIEARLGATQPTP